MNFYLKDYHDLNASIDLPNDHELLFRNDNFIQNNFIDQRGCFEYTSKNLNFDNCMYDHDYHSKINVQENFIVDADNKIDNLYNHWESNNKLNECFDSEWKINRILNKPSAKELELNPYYNQDNFDNKNSTDFNLGKLKEIPPLTLKNICTISKHEDKPSSFDKWNLYSTKEEIKHSTMGENNEISDEQYKLLAQTLNSIKGINESIINSEIIKRTTEMGQK